MTTLRQPVETETILAGLRKGADAYEKPQPEITAAIEAVEGVARDDAYDLKGRLRDLVMLYDQTVNGCGPPPTKEQWAKAWANAEEVFEP